MKKLINKRIVGSLLLVAGLFALNAKAMENPYFSQPDGGSVYGVWKGFPEFSFGGAKYIIKLGIEENKVTNYVTCHFDDGVKLSASVASKAEITDSSIKTLEAGSSQASESGHSCEASIEPGMVAYSLKDDKLTMSGNGQTITLTRE